MFKKRIIIIAGHYGAGKTNVATALAIKEKSENPEKTVTLIDLDTVNPYFRAADAESELKLAGVRPILPEFANTNVDIPTLPPEITSVFLSDETAFFDVGGDDGATALGVFEKDISRIGYEMLYVINMYRPLTESPEDAVLVMRDIESYSRLKFTGIINNSNLGAETDADTVIGSLDYANEVAKLAGLPIVFTSHTVDAPSLKCINNSLLMKNYTKALF